MSRFIHIGDLHIHQNNEEEDNRNCVAVVHDIVNRYSGDSPGKKPTVMLIGDIVDDGKETQYKNAVKILRPLVKNNFKVIACPGNHDYGRVGNFYTDKSQRHFQEYILGELLGIKEGKEYPKTKMEDIYPIVDTIDNTLFIGLDSVVGNEDDIGHFASGEVGKKQRSKLKNILKKNVGSKKNPVVVYFHHHPGLQRFLFFLLLLLLPLNKLNRFQ